MPSISPTLFPTVEGVPGPSPAPSIALITTLTSDLQSELSALTSTVLYQDMIIDGSAVIGECNSWLIGIGNPLSAILAAQKSTNVTLTTYDAITKNRIEISCDNHIIAPLIISSIITATTTATSTICPSSESDHTWIARVCSSGKTALCVDCTDPCGTLQCTDLQTINSCGSNKGNAYGCSSVKKSVNAYRVLSAVFEPISVRPIIQSISAVMNRTSSKLSVSLLSITNGSSADGSVNCAYYKPGTIPKTIAAIYYQNNAASSINGISTIFLDSLSPATSYDIYCIAQNILGSTMTYEKVLKTKTTVTTLCCKYANISLSVQSLYIGSSAVNAISVILDSLPTDSLTLTLGTNSVLSGQQFSLVPASTIVRSQLKTMTSYTYSISSVSTAALGVVQLTATLSGTSANEYKIIYTGRKDFTVLSLDTPPPVPVLTYVRFANDGLSLVAHFDSETNKGLIATSTFACSLLFSFDIVDRSTCSWTSTSTIVILFGPGSTLITGDIIIFLGTEVTVRAKCMSTARLCSFYDTVSITSVAILAPIKPIKPIISISAPSSIGLCDPYLLDLSSSIGGAGRPYSSIKFKITSTTNSTSAQKFYDEGYSLSPPTAVPHGTFPLGLNYILVVLCNFLGQCGQASVQLTVTTSVSPVVVINGNAARTVETSSGLLLQADSYVSSCTGENDRRAGLLYSWAVYNDGVRLLDMTSKSIKKQTFKLLPYTLSVDNLYIIHCTVFDPVTSQSSIKTVSVNIIRTNIIAVINGGISKSVRVGGSTVLDATGSYDQDQFGTLYTVVY